MAEQRKRKAGQFPCPQMSGKKNNALTTLLGHLEVLHSLAFNDSLDLPVVSGFKLTENGKLPPQVRKKTFKQSPPLFVVHVGKGQFKIAFAGAPKPAR